MRTPFDPILHHASNFPIGSGARVTACSEGTIGKKGKRKELLGQAKIPSHGLSPPTAIPGGESFREHRSRQKKEDKKSHGGMSI